MTRATIQRDRAGQASMASRYVASSFHENQKGHPRGALPRAREHGVVRVDHVVKAACYPSKAVLTFLPVNWRGVRLASFSRPHSHRSAPLLPAGRLVVPSAFASVRTITNSVRVVACKRSRAQSLPHQQPVNAFADRLHLSSVLSNRASSAGSQTSEALNGRVPNSCGAFQKQEGELPNVRG